MKNLCKIARAKSNKKLEHENLHLKLKD
jgi:hypothetical protein